MASERRSEISLLNVLFCLIVIFIHIISYAVSAFSVGTVKYTAVMIPWRLATFVVQGFVMLSGVKLFLTGKDNVPYGKYIKGRLKGVILPYALCFILYYVYYVIVYSYPVFDFSFFFKHFAFGSLTCHFYFIPLLFQFDILHPLWRRIVNNCSGIIVIPFALLFSALFEIYFPTMLNIVFPNLNFVYNDRIFTTYLAFWLIGCYIGKNYDHFVSVMKKNVAAISTIFGVALSLCVYFSYIAFNGFAYVPFMNLLHFIYVVCTIIFLYALALTIPKGVYEKIPLIKSIDKASYHIYLWHMLVLLITNDLIGAFSVTRQSTAFIIRALITYSVTITLCIIYGKLKKAISSRIQNKRTV